MLNLALRVPRTEAEGPGTRFAVWVQGCPLRCQGCCNPEFLPFAPALATTPEDLINACLAEGDAIEGVSFLGGEPFSQAGDLAVVARAVRARGLSVMVFTGHTLAELQARRDPATDALLAATDLLLDGPFLPRQRTTTRRWVGSDNQVLHFLTARYLPTDPRFTQPNHLELHLRDGELVLNGWPLRGARTTVGDRSR
ncbi:MAG: 4Fe-4S cluster-binding domain-containing protein [Deltaproteobacteria bacterium]|nr:4Fe-4S cluster-binding domain-containing protein [Deltaproteobacteria bacterium]